MNPIMDKIRLAPIKAPVFVHLDLTKHCNCNCIYCASHDNISPKKYFQVNYFKKIIDKLQEAEVFEISFFGGEPFLYPGIYKLGKYSKKKGLIVGFLSNGTLIRKQDMSKIRESFDGCGIALNGIEEVHDKLCRKKGAFKKTIATIEMFIKNDFPFEINAVVCRSNISYLDDFLNFLANLLQENSININLFSSRNNMKVEELLTMDEMKNAFHIIERHNQGDLKNKVSLTHSIPMCLLDREYSIYNGGCSAGLTFAGIDMYGNVKICPSSSTIIGNIFKSPLNEIWQKSKGMAYFKSNLWVDSHCKTCSLLTICHCGCLITSSTKKYSLPRYYKQHIKPIREGVKL
jgi:radical SAM protein with 4Fe4S-binding SPASM domain